MCSHRDSILVFSVPFNHDCWNFCPSHLRVNLWTLQFMFPVYNEQSSLILFTTDISFSIYSAFTCLTMVIERPKLKHVIPDLEFDTSLSVTAIPHCGGSRMIVILIAF